MENDRVKVAIIDQLRRFDEYSKKISLIKEAAAMDPSIKAKLQTEFTDIENKIGLLQRDIAVEERKVYNILSEDPGNLKLLERQNEKITRLKKEVDENEEKVGSIIASLEDLAKKEKLALELDAVQGAYKQCLTNLINLRNRFLKSYDEAEEETGIYFLTTPKAAKPSG